VVPVVFLTGCIENGLLSVGPSDERCLAIDVDFDVDPCYRVQGDVTVVATSTDAAGAVVEVPWDIASGGVYPYGAIFVASFLSGGDAMPSYVAAATILHPDLGPVPFSLVFPAPEGGPVYVQAIVDRDGDDILQVAEPSALLQIPDPDGEPLDDVHLYVSVPWEPEPSGGRDDDGDQIPNSLDPDVDGDGTPNEDDRDVDDDGTPNGQDLDIDGDEVPNVDDSDMDGDGVPNAQDADRDGDGEPNGTDQEPEGAQPPPAVILSGDAQAAAWLDCTAMAFSVNGYGPYNVARFPAVQDWTLYAAPNQGDVLLAGSCDTNFNGLVDPADAWGGWEVAGEVRSLLTIGDRDIGPLHLAIPHPGGPTTAAPLVAVSGTVLDLDGAAFGPDSVLYVVAQRGTNVPDPGALDHEYAYAIDAGTDLAGAATPFSLVVPAYDNVYLWAWVDRDGDGILNEPGESAAESGPWYTDVSHEDLELTLAPAAGP
jgi:hypothetical protein